MAWTHDDRKTVYEIIQRVGFSYPEMKEGNLKMLSDILDQAPEVLASFGLIEGEKSVQDMRFNGHIVTHSPLAEAVLHDHLEAAQIIIDALKNPKHAKKIIARLEAENRQNDCPSYDPLYMRFCDTDLELDKLASKVDSLFPFEFKQFPHQFIQSVDMLKLLHKNGYNFYIPNSQQPRSTLHEDIIHKLAYAVDYADDASKKAAEIAAPLLRATTELGITTHGRVYDSWGMQVRDKLLTGFSAHAYYKLCSPLIDYRIKKKQEDDFTEAQFREQEKLTCRYMHLVPAAGIDCRDILSPDFALNPDSDFQRENKQVFDFVRADLQHYVTAAAGNYLKETDPELRKDYARAACAGGTFPQLLSHCIEADAANGNTKEVRQVLTYLDEHWKNEYSNAIRLAVPTFARIAPPAKEMEASPLNRYVRADTVSQGKA